MLDLDHARNIIDDQIANETNRLLTAVIENAASTLAVQKARTHLSWAHSFRTEGVMYAQSAQSPWGSHKSTERAFENYRRAYDALGILRNHVYPQEDMPY